MHNLNIYSFRIKISVEKFLASANCTLGTPQTATWPGEPIILLIGHFKSPTEVHLNS